LKRLLVKGVHDDLEEPHFHELDMDVIRRELDRLRNLERPGPSAESILRDVGLVAAGRAF
jgi:hypothetical protein